MKFRKLAIYSLALALAGSAASCESPLKDFNLQISTEVIQHYATLRVVNSNNASVANATVTLVSGDTQDIYNLDGRKDFKITGDLVSFGLDPARMPTAANPVRFRVEISAPGYTTQIVPVAITDASAGIETIVLTQPANLPEGAEQIVENVPLTSTGATTAATTVAVASATEGTAGNVQLTIPAGTQFLDAQGNTLVGSSVRITITSVDANNDEAVDLLPGGNLVADEVVAEDGSTTSGAFASAGVVDVKMLVNGVAVKSFSQPIGLSMPLNPNYVSPATGQALTTGHVLQIFSNSDSDRVWTFEENNAVVGTAATGFRANFSIDHLTFYMAGEFGEACEAARSVVFSGDWMANGSTYPIIVETWWGGRVLTTTDYSISASNATIAINNVPAVGTSIVVKSGAGNILEQAPLGACGAVTNMRLPNPGDATGTVSTLQLYVRCPDATSTITLLPTFQLYYRVTGTSEFKYLGAVDNGFLRTTLLKTDGTQYDFRAIWKSHVKTVGAKTIQADNSATVGIQPGDIIGEKAGATNLAILTEECGNL
ncbi:hypothetical protein [Sphingobacterium griseoflavum]|uniref:DUF4382 domain-containing protein n=1 Tax=Sphingobacterium griseoflavum TaxID=1474952 RepID=A0ABQ3HVL0_9SPHI|nr:hypothetical protein [Sphingobacterium griseoflavum]GHE39018.1 hypothetical protein GCM10017764_22760 [Sphingobacterium griseoflavum]